MHCPYPQCSKTFLAWALKLPGKPPPQEAKKVYRLDVHFLVIPCIVCQPPPISNEPGPREGITCVEIRFQACILSRANSRSSPATCIAMHPSLCCNVSHQPPNERTQIIITSIGTSKNKCTSRKQRRGNLHP